jgi:sec-independent protein translocase protein TatB
VKPSPVLADYERNTIMLGLSFDKILLLGLVAVLVIGPQRLPEYAAKLARLVRTLRTMADGAKARLKDEMGPEFDDVDWVKLDPRQYDPRRIIREALGEDIASTATVPPDSNEEPPRVGS